MVVRDKGIDPQVIDMTKAALESFADQGKITFTIAEVHAVLKMMPEKKLAHPHKITEAEVRRAVQALVMDKTPSEQINYVGPEMNCLPGREMFSTRYGDKAPVLRARSAQGSNLTLGLGQN
jgi:hypothetical protein